jgi:hypothetical protein
VFPDGRCRPAVIIGAFRPIARVMAPEAYVVQLVGFSDASRQLPVYLKCMRAAGLAECKPQGGRLGRRVLNRKWYAKLKGSVDASTEVLLIQSLPLRAISRVGLHLSAVPGRET